jgi:uncharacterized SAM-binding protein YcdF (DUF218 family)
MLSSLHLAPGNPLMMPVILFAGKAFTDPLFLATLVILLSLLAALRRTPRKRALLTALAADVALALFSTGLVGAALEHSLLVSDAPLPQPDVIVVAASGSHGGVLSSTSAERLALGVACWRQHPQARLVMVGLDTSLDGALPRTVNLMRADGIRMGVPPSAISLDPSSRNTREHPLALKSLGFKRSTRVAIATSSWHLRRTLQEFRRHFAIVGPCHAVPENEELTIDDLVPNTGELYRATVMLHEWLGIAWYALRA